MLDAPAIKTTIDDSLNTGVIYHVFAYRRLSKAEALQAVRVYLSGRKRAPKRGAEISIVTVIGHDE